MVLLNHRRLQFVGENTPAHVFLLVYVLSNIKSSSPVLRYEFLPFYCMKYKTCIRMVRNYLTFLPRATCRLRGNGSSGSMKVLTFQETTKYPLSCLTVRGGVNVGGVVSRKQGPIDYKKN